MLFFPLIEFFLGRMNAGRIGGRGSRGNLVEDEGFRFQIEEVDDD